LADASVTLEEAYVVALSELSVALAAVSSVAVALSDDASSVLFYSAVALV
jgi:cobalamin biosynthesis protein CobD/CbiB